MDNLHVAVITNNDQPLWDRVSAFAASCSWQETGQFLSEKMKKNDFLPWERVFAAMQEDAIAGFCAFTKDSAVLGSKYSPYLGFLFVDETYRGRHIGKALSTAVIQYAAELGFPAVNLYTDLQGYYEKHGFSVIGQEIAPWGERMLVYSYPIAKIAQENKNAR